jgi:A/G-specific adenine glycosylase
MTGTLSEFQRRLLRWYDGHRRDLPWRLPLNSSAGDAALDPYHVLVSEAMLQQTQVATVIPYFRSFLEKFPTLPALANADLQEVLRAWQGLGYYSRARNLQKAAMKILTDFDGHVPSDVEQLLELPGVGRYTAGAVASLAFGNRAPILDGNVARVLCRLDAVKEDPRELVTRELLWVRAEEILPRKRVGDFNSALMELGALICTPRSPRCLLCPLNKQCSAYAAGISEQIPPPKKAKPIPLIQRWTFCIRSENRYLIEQRPASGRWAGMWQFVTIEPTKKRPSVDLIRSQFSLRTSMPKPIGTVEHALTHRRYHFHIFLCDLIGPVESPPPRKWVTLKEIVKHPLPRPQVKIIDLLE